MIIYLVGYMGCGKTTTGKLLAERLGYDFIDMDDCIQKITGQSITSIFKAKGEKYFREVEARILRSIEQENVVVATGGGCPLHHNNIDYILNNGRSVYLKMTPELAFERLKDAKSDRPLLKGLSDKLLLDWIKGQMAQRERVYTLANIQISADEIDFENLVAKVQFK
jgi:shikimate kinase